MSVSERVMQIVETMCAEDAVVLTDHLETDLSFDSLMMVTLLIEIESEFEIELDEADMNPFALNTVEDVVALVEKYYD